MAIPAKSVVDNSIHFWMIPQSLRNRIDHERRVGRSRESGTCAPRSFQLYLREINQLREANNILRTPFLHQSHVGAEIVISVQQLVGIAHKH